MKKTLAVLMVSAAMCSTLPAFALDLGTDYNAKAQYYMSKIDTDKDGKISKAEHEAFADQMFANADTDKDGYVSLAELTAAKKAEAKDEKANSGMNNKVNIMKKDLSSMKTDLMNK